MVATMFVVACLAKPDRVDVSPSPDAPVAIDAPGGACDKRCSDKGGTCSINGTCLIHHVTQARADCPDGMPCRVECVGQDACKLGGVDCKKATSCEVVCDGKSACEFGGVDCGSAATCNVTCDGDGACRQGGMMTGPSIECRGADCDVVCRGGTATCEHGIATDASCTSHCCDGACGTGTCSMNDATCP